MTPRATLLSLLLPALLACPAAPAAAQQAKFNPPMRMFLEMDDGSVQTIEASAADAKGITVTLPDGKGSLTYPMNRVKSWRIDPPKEWRQGEEAIQKGQPDKAVALMRPHAVRLIPLLGLQKGDAASDFFKFAGLLRSRGDHKGALELLGKVPEESPSDIRAHAIVLAAYCRAMLGEVDAAETQLNMLRAPTRRSALFTLYKLTRARIAQARKDLVTALDEIASVIAYKRLGSDSYDEALYLSAEAYDELGAAINKQKEMIAADPKLKRLYEQNRGEAFDALGVMRSDKSSVSAIMDEPPDLPGVSIEIRKQLVRVFPTSPWAALARAKLPPGALDKMATGQPEPEGAAKKPGAKSAPSPTPAPAPVDDGLIDTEKPASERENL